MIEIDGSYLEGGGAILRVASALSAVTGKPLRVHSIRAKRKNPGLRAQHLESLKAVASLCSGRLVNAALGSTEIELHPGTIASKRLSVEISTAGAVGLLFQSLSVPMLMADDEVSLDIRGGATFAKWAPPLVYAKNILLPILSRMGCAADIEIRRHGFYPVGGSRVEIRARPSKNLKPLNLTEAGDVEKVQGISIASEHLQKPRVADRQAEAAKKVLKNRGVEADIEIQYVDAACAGSGIVLWARTSTGAVLGADSLGERGKPSEKVGEEAADEMLRTIESGAAVDEHLSDQLLIFLALCRGESAITTPRLTDHARTNISVIRKFLPVKFRIGEEGVTRIECSGLK